MVTQLPYLQSDSPILNLIQTKWRSILNLFLSNPSLQSSILTGVKLSSGPNTINHLLGRKLVGWRIIGINQSASIYDAQATNPTPNLTLVLNASAPVQVNLEVF